MKITTFTKETQKRLVAGGKRKWWKYRLFGRLIDTTILSQPLNLQIMFDKAFYIMKI